MVTPTQGLGRPAIGVVAVQGGFSEHMAMLRAVGAEPRKVRRPGDLAGLAGLVLPGGESTTIGGLLYRSGLAVAIREWIGRGSATWGTCAGLILLADRVSGQKINGQPLIGGLDIEVTRNYFGRQTSSFETKLPIAGFDPPHGPAIFIRAPAIVSRGAHVASLAELPDGTCVALRQGNVLGTAFHPELTSDTRWHRLFVEMSAAEAAPAPANPADRAVPG